MDDRRVGVIGGGPLGSRTNNQVCHAGILAVCGHRAPGVTHNHNPHGLRHTGTSVLRASLPDAIAVRCPSLAEAKPVIDWVNRAIERAQIALEEMKDKDADDSYRILVYALDTIIATRERKGSDEDETGVCLSLPNCNNIDLAYADHYLQNRAEAFNLGPKGRAWLQSKAKVYNWAKSIGLSYSTGVCPPSPVADFTEYWEMKGIEDGLKDYKDKDRPRSFFQKLRHLPDELHSLW
jgi:hypothetical protein